MIKVTAKNLIILFTELAVVFLMAFGLVPREAGLILTGLLIFYFIFSPLEDSLWVFIASIPLFVALPIIENFDSMANWRILLAVLFLVWLVKVVILRTKPEGSHGIRSRFFASLRMTFGQLEQLTGIFLLIGLLSLLVADDIWIGIKKLLFLINIFLLYIIIKNLATKNKEIINKIISATKVAIGLTLGIGFAQLVTVFFVPLHTFWQFWARSVIPVFYGQTLGELLSQSNAWFSYYNYLPPTLRMFSVFPDSHSFAFFCILSLPFFLTMIFWPDKEKSDFLLGTRTGKYLFLIGCLLAIIFSGSRGAWLSALGTLILFLFFILLYWSPTMRSWIDFFIPWLKKKWSKQIQLIIGTLIIFFLLFPVSSGILLLSQKAQVKELDLEKISLFERAKTITDVSELSAKNRLEIWQRTIDSIAAQPLLGVGIGNYPLILNEDVSSAKRGASAHNLYLDVAAEMGIFALLILLGIFWLIFKDAWQLFLKGNRVFFRVWAGFFTLALIWILGYSLFDVVLYNDKVLLFFMVNLGLIYAIKSSARLNKSADL